MSCTRALCQSSQAILLADGDGLVVGLLVGEALGDLLDVLDQPAERIAEEFTGSRLMSVSDILHCDDYPVAPVGVGCVKPGIGAVIPNRRSRASWHRTTRSYIHQMTYDLIIRNGTIVDGLGGEPFVGDVAVTTAHRRGRRRHGAAATREIDAPGCWSRPASSTCTPTTTARRSGRSD